MMKFRKAASLIVLFACVFLVVSYARDHLSDFRNLSNISVYYMFQIGGLFLSLLIVNGLFLKALTIDFGIDLCFHEYFSISVITSFGNIFLPMRGGAGVRAVYLKSRYNLDYSYFLSSLAGNYLIIFNVTSAAALAGMAVLYFYTGGFSFLVAGVFFFITVATSWAIFLPPAKVDWIPIGWARMRINKVLSGWHRIRKSGKTVLDLFILTILFMTFATVITWLEFTAFHMEDISGNPVGLLQAMIFTSIGHLTLLVAITPAALGIRETMLMFSAQFLGISPSQALAVSLLDRTVGFLVLGLSFGFAWFNLKKQLCVKNPAPPAE